MKDFFEHIDEYIEGSLSPSQVTAFEAEMKRDSSLQHAVDHYQEAKKLSEGLLEVDMMETLGELEKEQDDIAKAKMNDSNFTSKKTSGLKWFFLLGFIGALLFGAWWLNNKDDVELDKEMILASYERPIDLDATRSIDTTGMNTFEKGKYFFALNRFEESEKWFKVFLKDEKNDKLLSQAYYWLGAAHLEQWEVDEAKKAWEESIEEGVEWNMGLIK